MKPLIRWVIGPVYEAGFRCLAVSYREMKRCYGDEFDYLICHNQLDARQKRIVEAIGCPTYEQKESDFPVKPTYWPEDVGSLKGTRCAWKLYPPRMRPESHEIILDNDVIIHRQIEMIFMFINGGRPMLSQGRRRNYGCFDDKIPSGIVYNNGIIGLPPGLDFQARLMKFLPKDWEWTGFFDDQGLVVASLIDYLPHVLSTTDIALCGPQDPLPTASGIHFVGINSNKKHQGWNGLKARLKMT